MSLDSAEVPLITTAAQKHTQHKHDGGFSAARMTLWRVLCASTWTGLFVAQLRLHTVPLGLDLRGTRRISSLLAHARPVS